MDAAMVPFERLEHGAYYRGTCRNGSVARWNAEALMFVHWRTKFGGYWIDARPGESRFVEFRPFERLESSPFEIPATSEEFEKAGGGKSLRWALERMRKHGQRLP